ncbi:junctional protein associated with coronary artery disease [Carlito syrichta]|uniref:Junctional protein associated with coronary artery disease n=1 Tax=Carlito syrichta TaxID=1868482 RepID=A0A1U7UU90_CARSF|nr:junctional protein associated with coronary artery disease [Carlito syrichta]
MYSVEDLLISHGYKLARDRPAPHEDSSEGRRPGRTRTRTGHGLLNGHEDGPAASVHHKTSTGKGPGSDSESRRSTPRGHGEPQGASVSRTSEAGFYHQSTLAWASQPQNRNDQACWWRGQKVGSWLGPKDREDLEVRGMAQAHGLPVHTREGPWQVAGRTENVMKKAVWEEELRMSGSAKWQNVSLESWNQARRLGRQMSDGDGERLFQDLYPFIEGEHVLNSQNKRKSQSLPRVISPENLSCTEIPIPLHDGHSAKMSPYSPYSTPNVESTRNLEKGPLPRPKFGRPLKPPSYGSHQQSRGGGESSDSQDSQHTDPHVPRHEFCLPESGLEPPMYVPPPSYRSPPLHIPNPYLEDTAPSPACGSHSQQQLPTEKASGQLPSGPLGTGHTYGASPRSARGLPTHLQPTTAFGGSIQYIPFDDPRIRHIKLAAPQGFGEDAKPDDQSYDSSPVTAPEPADGKLQPTGAILTPQSLIPPSGSGRIQASANPSPQWLWGQLPRDGENDDFPDQRDHYVSRGQWPNMRGDQQGHTDSHVSSPHPWGESTCETQTKLKKFETGIQTKKSSKKKMNETIFCLVSIPVKSEPHLPDIDMDNNDSKPSTDKRNGLDGSVALRPQHQLSMSATDLELQALTGSMAGRMELQKQDLGEPEDRQTHDLRLSHLTTHRELKYSGSWPGHQYRDQQTQTSFPEESQSSQLLSGATLGGPKEAVLAPRCPDGQTHAPIASRDHRQRPDAQNLKGQRSLSPSNNSAFSRTSSSINQASVPKAGRGQPYVDIPGHGASPGPKPEVVKGEPTGPCNSKQLFGQFLLKPVSRRPWDLISQLESFNKELQEEEASSGSHSSNEDSESEQQWEDRVDSSTENLGVCGNSPERRGERQPGTWVQEDPVFRSGRGEARPENWSEELAPGHPCAHAPSPGPSPVESSSAASFWPASGSSHIDQRHQGAGNRRNQPAASPGPVKRVMSSGPSDAKPMPPSYPAEPREPPESQEPSSASNSVKASQAVLPGVDSSPERGVVLPLSLTSKNRGLSAPDLRSLGLTTGQELSASKPEGSSGEASTIEIPPGESLQARAARILGIEVAVESLLPGTRRAGQSQHPEPDISACSPESPREALPSTGASLPSTGAPTGGPATSTDAFYGRRKCGWTESPLFVGDRDGTRRAPQASERSGADGVVASEASSPEPQSNSLESKCFDQKDVGAKPPFRSTLFHFVERTPSVTGSEKRLRSPSKVIESLQEKLASPPRRADPDRLMRMKEVSSVSRMRFLSFRGTDSLEEAEDLRVVRGQVGLPGGFTSLSGGDQAQRVGHSLSVSRDSVSREENEHPTAQWEKNVDQDFWCPDSYDPSRVEKV